MNTLRDQYKSLIRGQIEDEQAKYGALEDIGVEEYLKKNPGSSREQALKVLRQKRNKPIGAVDPNDRSTWPKKSQSWQGSGRW